MAFELRLQQKLSQQLVMTPQLQQAIKLLQLNHLELADVLQAELAENPILEEREGDEPYDSSLPEVAGAAEGNEPTADGNTKEVDAAPDPALDAASVLESKPGETPEPTNDQVKEDIDWEAYLESYSYSLPASEGGAAASGDLPSFEQTMSAPTSLADHIRWQIQMHEFDDEQIPIALLLADELTDDGYLLPDAIETVADETLVDPDVVRVVVREMQSFDPVGVFAADLRECLLLQAQQLDSNHPLLEAIIDKHLGDVERRRYQVIAKALGVSMQEVGEAVKHFALLDPRPGRAYNDREAQYITPDIYVHKVGDDYIITLNDDGLPKLRISNYYRSAIDTQKGNTKNYIQEKMRSAAWLIRSIHMRQRTIYKVTESILKFQRAFFDEGVTHLKPLILKDVAEDVEMHESTVSRVKTNKYVHTPRGIFELKYFFNSSINRIGKESIASESVRDHIKRLIDEEDPRKPLSDQKIVSILKQRDIDIARRTVAKYREMLMIPSSSKRRQVF